ncbi:MAG TPA: galactokinase family protein [Ktedonobacteraceae bacterium]|nr:galactokinase family protein [Ktedonobacteraceae bacterium]
MMWRFDQLAGETIPGLTAFLASLQHNKNFFDQQQPLRIARAPGRLDLMGGIADYSGSLVLELPLALATWVAVQPDATSAITIRSTAIVQESEMVFPLETLAHLDSSSAHTLLTADPTHSWCAYIIGTLLMLHREHTIPLQGLRLFIHSDLPAGKGVSSSAALEVATMQALCGLYDLPLDGREIALLCQQAENLIVGAPCGIMDQMTAVCGQQDSLLALLCQPAELQPAILLPPEMEVWGLDSGIRHAVSGADYGSVRVGAFMGYRIIAELAGLSVLHTEDQRVEIADPLWQGHLANIAPSLWENSYRDRVPLQMTGADFLTRYGGFTDRVTKIDPAQTYAIRQPTAHPIYEHQRVRLFRSLLTAQNVSEEQLLLLGELMYQSHESYSACGLGSTGTDQLVALIRQAGPANGLYGAKITGGGSGGTVAVLTRRGAYDQIKQIASLYSEKTGLAVEILGGSSPGSLTWKTHLLLPDG